MKVRCFFAIVYTDEDFPDKFFDEDLNMIATNAEIKRWARDKYTSDITDIINNEMLYPVDLIVQITGDKDA